MAKCNGWNASELLANASVQAHQRLNCKLVERLPRGWGLEDSSGYILMRLKSAPTPRGHSFAATSTANNDADYVPSRRRRTAAARKAEKPGHLVAPSAASPPTTRRLKSSSSYMEVSPPSSTAVGCTQPMLERYHRALLAAATPAVELKDGLVLHSCGNKNCAVVSHFYLGNVDTNVLDTNYHKRRKSTSRQCHPCLQ